jgi:alkaline phosphatase
MITRRNLFRRSAALPAAGILGMPALALSQEELLTKSGQKPKKIILIVSDGMSIGTFSCANLLSLETEKRQTHWVELMKRPGAVQALMNTRSLNSPVTDSSAASSAWGSGSRIVNGCLNMLPDERELTPIMRLVKAKGWKTALVSTAEITHATPAGFVAVQWSRGDANEIAPQYLQQQVDVVLGGGSVYFDGKRRKDKRDLKGEFAAAGYQVVTSKEELAKADAGKRILGLFAEGHLPYTVDQKNSDKHKNVPTLAEMTTSALAHLQDAEHFLLQVEGARVDHAAHNSDAAGAILDQLALDEAIKVCLDFQAKHPDTLVVVTTDHANSNLGLNGMDGGYKGSGLRFKNLLEVKMTIPEILKLVEKKGRKIKLPKTSSDPADALKNAPNPYAEHERQRAAREAKENPGKFTANVQTASGYEISPADFIQILEDTTGYRPSEKRAGLFCDVMRGVYAPLYDQLSSPANQLGQLLGNRLGIGWTGNTHTADHVNLVAYGPGAEKLGGFLENTDIFDIFTAFAGVDHKNPELPHYAGAGPEAHEVEDSGETAMV